MKSYNGRVRFTFQISRQFLIHTEKIIQDTFLMYIYNMHLENHITFMSQRKSGRGGGEGMR